MAIVYRHRRLDNNEIFYIGIGKTEKRAYSEDKRNRFWKHIVQKSGYTIEIIAENLDYDDAKELEILLIKAYGRKDTGSGNLVNLTDGGDGCTGFIITEEYRKKLSEANRGKVFSESHRYKIGIKSKGRKANLGNLHSEEAKRKIGEKSRGRIKSNETLIKISQSNKGGNNGRSKTFLNTETGIYYYTLNEAANSINLNRYKFKVEINNSKIPFILV